MEKDLSEALSIKRPKNDQEALDMAKECTGHLIGFLQKLSEKFDGMKEVFENITDEEKLACALSHVSAIVFVHDCTGMQMNAVYGTGEALKELSDSLPKWFQERFELSKDGKSLVNKKFKE